MQMSVSGIIAAGYGMAEDGAAKPPAASENALGEGRSGEDLSEYEQQRLAQIARNRAMLSALGVQTAARELHNAAQRGSGGGSASESEIDDVLAEAAMLGPQPRRERQKPQKRTSDAPTVAPRQSKRVRGEQPENTPPTVPVRHSACCAVRCALSYRTLAPTQLPRRTHACSRRAAAPAAPFRSLSRTRRGWRHRRR